MEKRIGMFTLGLPIGADTLETKSLGGSESAFIYMARELSKLGNSVKCFTVPDGAAESMDKFGVRYYDYRSLKNIAETFEFDAFLCYRHWDCFNLPLRSKMNILVCHDVIEEAGPLMANMYKVDNLWLLSKYHCDLFTEKVPDLKEHIWQTTNGIDLDLIDSSTLGGLERESASFVYGSRPERGLEPLLKDIFPAIRCRIPDAKLYISGYDITSAKMKIPEGLSEYYAMIAELIANTEGVIPCGFLGKRKWYQLLATCTAMLYPTEFPEISCINALESMACGTPIISTADFALTETIGKHGVLINGNVKTPEYKKAFIDAAVDIVSNHELRERLQKSGRNWVADNYKWSHVAKKWDKKIDRLFEERFESNKSAICKRLIANSDLVAAHKMAKKYDLPEWEKIAKDRIDNTKVYQENWDLEGAAEEQYLSTDPSGLLRFNAVAELVSSCVDINAKMKVLDIGGHIGEGALVLSNLMPNATVDSFESTPQNYRPDYIKRHAKYPENITIGYKGNPTVLFPDDVDLEELKGKYDVIFCGEILEHIIDTTTFVKQVESLLKVGGTVIYTVPSGCWEPYRQDLSWFQGRIYQHVHHFELDDIQSIFGDKQDIKLLYGSTGKTQSGERVGNWIFSYTKMSNKSEFGVSNFKKKILTTRPYQTVSLCMITYNEEDHISRCLKSVRDIVDEVIIADTGSTDTTLDIARKLFPNKLTIKHIGKEFDGDGLFNFGAARNKSIEDATGDWILWLDCDEVLTYPEEMPKYLDAPVFNGFVIHQCHLMLDVPDGKLEPDTPVRLLRNNKDYKFIGAIHEMCVPDINENIHPALILPDVKIAHYGYITESVRRWKCGARNMRLLLKDRKLFPERKVGHILVMRDYQNLAQWELESSGGVVTQKAVNLFRAIAKIWIEEISVNEERNSPHWKMAYAFYQSALNYLGKVGLGVSDNVPPPFQISYALAGSNGPIPDDRNYQPVRYWFSTKEEYDDFMSYTTAEFLKKIHYGE